MKRTFIPIMLLLFLMPACQKSIIVQHPDSIDALDSNTYDVLTTAQSVLDNTKIAINQGKLPAFAKAISNNAGAAYNTLRDVWLQYRANPNATIAEKVKAAALTLNDFILQLRGIGVKP